MAGIFLSGGSGSGKTTFCRLMNSRYNTPLVVDVLRGIHKNNPDISNLSVTEKQLIYATEYIKLHHLTEPKRFISDRSILNVLAFWKLNPEVAQYLGLQNKQPDLIVLIPVPSYQWYVDHIEYFADPIRIDTYKARMGETRTFLGKDDVATLFYQQDREMFNRMEAMCEYLEWPFFIPEMDATDSDNFQPFWQHQAHDIILQAWEIENPKYKTMHAEEVPIEEYYKRVDELTHGKEEDSTEDYNQHLNEMNMNMRGGDLDGEDSTC